MISKFVEHPKDVGESYLTHFSKACSFGFKMLKLSFICFSHAVLPWTFEKTASGEIIDMAEEMEERRELMDCED